ncbi:molybdenum cofactor biosynthesis protein MoaE (plasmid) [Moraxella osloensis]|jgi:molybdopterin synthase catalytic subunit|uniref:Molybdopterin synthase catalytic subunit n=2 Tax=Pseudomonadota TaxID=1224 RepID=A0A173MZA4_FAUOS|nr:MULTISPECIES: molybdenum cofactor biosynthesis protein MoaE [Pseudomonadota]ATQ84183.1 molybdenum cofactor biosynthesis protein MoaE [Moraxella osloensis]ATQ86237.1 molybdenum cofactor biosynthesis protein MoaE [Moraxella osloensis]ATW86672.1 molybdenum cofactor biosynthesis protein MoaE [Moraxella osloensis]KND22030.1 molybdopterin biosynthesis MoaE [Enhydrobacter aerosaccus]OBX55774.1 molybdenum cofactor biosynthesis protein MoaE [Moraxella osloensis]
MSSLHKGSSIISISGNEAYDIAIEQGFALLDKPINDRRLKLALLNDQSGALATFEGWVRNHNNARPVTKLTYYGYEKLAINQGEKLITQAKQQFDIINAVAIHRIGDLAIGDMAVWIGVTAHHRYPAFDACRWLLDAIKADIPVWKQEFYADSEESLWLSNNG